MWKPTTPRPVSTTAAATATEDDAEGGCRYFPAFIDAACADDWFAQLRDAVVIQAPAAGSRVGLGSVVTVETDGDEMRLEIVGTTESSPKDGRISGSSPVGRALLSGAVGDEVTVQSPSGPIAYRIVAID